MPLDIEDETSSLLRNHIMVPYKLEGTLVVLLANENLVGRLADEIEEISRPKVGLEDTEYKFESSNRFPVAGRIHSGSIATAIWNLLKQ